MRWNSKFEEKAYRYDAILYSKKNLKPISSIIFGDTPELLIGSKNIFYENVIIPKDKRTDSKLKYINKYVDEEQIERNQYNLFISFWSFIN